MIKTRLLIFFLLISLCITTLSARDYSGGGMIILKANDNRKAPPVQNLTLGEVNITDDMSSIIFNSGDNSFQIMISDEGAELDMQIKGRPFNGYFEADTDKIMIFSTDNSLIFYFSEPFTMAATTMSVPTAYYIQPGSVIYFYSGNET